MDAWIGTLLLLVGFLGGGERRGGTQMEESVAEAFFFGELARIVSGELRTSTSQLHRTKLD